MIFILNNETAAYGEQEKSGHAIGELFCSRSWTIWKPFFNNGKQLDGEQTKVEAESGVRVYIYIYIYIYIYVLVYIYIYLYLGFMLGVSFLGIQYPIIVPISIIIQY